MKIRTGWTPLGIVGCVFAPIGALFAGLSFLFRFTEKSASWHGTNAPEILQLVFGAVGGMFLAMGLIFLYFEFRRRHLLQRAYDGGNCVDAEILGVAARNNVSLNGRHPVVVECAYTDPSGVVHIYRSRYLYTDVTDLLKSRTVPVYIDRLNENIGFVDIDAVLPEIRIH